MAKRSYLIILILSCSVQAVTIPLNSFNAGEMSPLMEGRNDFTKYNNACRQLRNMFVLSQGPAMRRPGTYYIGETETMSEESRLIPFVFSETDTYILEFGDEYIRFYRNDGRILTSTGTEDLSSLNNIVAHYLLNDDIDDKVVLDDDGATYNGVATENTDTLSIEAKVNDGFNLAGSSTIEINDNANFTFDDSGTNPFSLIAWVYVDGVDAMQVIVSKWKEDTSREWRLSMDNSQHLQMHFSDDSIDLTSNYVAQWYLNDNAVDTHVDDVSTNYDGVSSANTGSITVTGKISTALDFGGDKYVTVADAAGLSFGNGTADSAFSIAAWIYVTDGVDSQHILTKYDENVAVEWKFFLNTLEHLHLSLRDDSASAHIYAATSDSLSLGWHHVVSTYDATEANTGLTLYVDGEAASVDVGSGGTYIAMENTATDVLMGAAFSSSSQTEFFDSILDNVTLFGIELTAANVLNFYNTGFGTESLATTFPNVVADDALSIGWNLVGMTYDSTGGSTAASGVLLYVNGAVVDSTATNEADYIGMENTAIKVRIGAQYSSTSVNEKIWRNKIDNVAIFSDVLTATEIATLYTTEIYEIESPYQESELFDIQYIQNGNIMYLDQGNHPPHKLTRTLHDDWTIADVNYIDGPFLDENITTTTLAPSATTGAITIVSSTAIFSRGHVGSIWQICHTGSPTVKITSYVDPTEVTAVVHETLGGTTTTTHWSEGYWSDKNGYPQTIEFHEFRLFFGGSSSYPQTLWASKSGDFTDYESMYFGTDDDDALIYDLPGQNPIQFMHSYDYLIIGTLGGIGRMGDVDEPMTPTTAPQYRQQTPYGSAFIPAISTGDAILYVGRGGEKVREFAYSLERDRFTSPDITVLAEHITGDGIVDIAYQIRPDSVLWCVLADGDMATMTYNKEHDVFAWSLQVTDGDYESVAIIPSDDEDEVWTIVNRTVDSNTVRLIEQFQPRDWGADDDDAWFVDSGLDWDGGAAVDISGATKANPCVITVSVWPTEGDGTDLADDDQIKILSVAGMTELNGNIYTVDDADSSAKTFSLDNSAGSANIDSTSYTTYTSGGTAQRFEKDFTNLDHIEGEAVTVFGDGTARANNTVSSGAIETSNWYNKVLIGLPFTSILETMPLVINTQRGSTSSQYKNIINVAFDFHNTLGLSFGVDEDHLTTKDYDDMTTGWKEYRFSYGKKRSATIYIETAKPIPLTIRQIIPEVELLN